jgi:recombination-promoting nuclease RpnB
MKKIILKRCNSQDAYVDLLYKTTFKSEDGYIWILLEHQRKNDPWLPVRIFKYMALIWDHIRRTSKVHKIPLVYPLVIYNGERPYSHTLTFRDMIEPDASKELFDTFFKAPFCLIDLTIIEDKTLKKQLQNHVSGVALLMTLKHVFAKNIQELFEQLLVDAYKDLDQSGHRDDLVDMLYYLLNESEFLNEERFWEIIRQSFSPETEGKMMTIVQKMERRVIDKKNAEFAKKLLNERIGLSEHDLISLVKRLTGLSEDKIQELRKKH